MRPGLAGSSEALFHEVGMPGFMLNLRDADAETREVLSIHRLERAIGVIYLPATERRSHYFHAKLTDQFDAVIHWDETRAVEPLDPTSQWTAGEDLPDTYPSAL